MKSQLEGLRKAGSKTSVSPYLLPWGKAQGHILWQSIYLPGTEQISIYQLKNSKIRTALRSQPQVKLSLNLLHPQTSELFINLFYALVPSGSNVCFSIATAIAIAPCTLALGKNYRGWELEGVNKDKVKNKFCIHYTSKYLSANLPNHK